MEKTPNAAIVPVARVGMILAHGMPYGKLSRKMN